MRLSSTIASLFAPILFTVFGLFGTASATAATITLTDSFTYSGIFTGASPLSNTWTRISGSGDLTDDALRAPDVKFSSNYLQIQRNVVLQRQLGTGATIAGDFTLSATVSFSDYGAGKQLWFGIFDADGTHGYVAHFNSQTSGGGVVRLKEFDVASPGELTYNLSGTNLTTSAASSGLTSAVDTSARLSLVWSAADQKLTLLVNGTAISSLSGISIAGAPVSEFSYLYIGGNTGAQFSDIELTGVPQIPEPTPAALPAIGSILLIAGSRWIR